MMDHLPRMPASPGTPLFPVSPERANRQQYPHPHSVSGGKSPGSHGVPVNAFVRPASAMMSAGLSSPTAHRSTGINGLDIHVDPVSRQSSSTSSNNEVQDKVAQFNSLARDAAQRRRDQEAALRRAVLGREEAEAEAMRWKEEAQQLKNESSRLRDEGLCQREETRKLRDKYEGLKANQEQAQKQIKKEEDGLRQTLQVELQRAKDTHTRAKQIYEKEVRRARKEAFNSSSAVVSLQDELKHLRQEHASLQHDRDEAMAVQQSSSRDVAKLRGEIEVLQQQCDAVSTKLAFSEEMREALKRASKADEVARLASKGQLALPPESAQPQGGKGLTNDARINVVAEEDSRSHGIQDQNLHENTQGVLLQENPDQYDETNSLSTEALRLLIPFAHESSRWKVHPASRTPWFDHPICGWGPVDKYLESEIAEREEAEEMLWHMQRRVEILQQRLDDSKPAGLVQRDQAAANDETIPLARVGMQEIRDHYFGPSSGRHSPWPLTSMSRRIGSLQNTDIASTEAPTERGRTVRRSVIRQNQVSSSHPRQPSPRIGNSTSSDHLENEIGTVDDDPTPRSTKVLARIPQNQSDKLDTNKLDTTQFNPLISTGQAMECSSRRVIYDFPTEVSQIQRISTSSESDPVGQQDDLESFTQVIPTFSALRIGRDELPAPSETDNTVVTTVIPTATRSIDEHKAPTPLRSTSTTGIPLPRTPRIITDQSLRAPRTISHFASGTGHSSSTTIVPIENPMAYSSSIQEDTGLIEGLDEPLDREKALEQIRERRGRARSLAENRAATPGKSARQANQTEEPRPRPATVCQIRSARGLDHDLHPKSRNDTSNQPMRIGSAPSR